MPHDLPSTCRRHNHVNAAYVNAAVKIKAALGLRRAEDFLAAQGISRKIMARVLLSGTNIRRVGEERPDQLTDAAPAIDVDALAEALAPKLAARLKDSP